MSVRRAAQAARRLRSEDAEVIAECLEAEFEDAATVPCEVARVPEGDMCQMPAEWRVWVSMPCGHITRLWKFACDGHERAIRKWLGEGRILCPSCFRPVAYLKSIKL